MANPLNIETQITPIAHPFLRPVTQLTPAQRRQRAVSRAVSWMLVALLHILLFFGIVITFRPFTERNRPLVETILTLPMPGNNAPPLHIVNPVLPNNNPPVILSAPITLPRPPPVLDERNTRPVTPGDILGAVGRTLACSAGSWEHLTAPERAACGGVPWRAMRLPNGNLVMVPPSQLPRLKEPPPDTGFDINSGADRQQRDIQNGQNPANNGCPILQQMPCTHVTPAYRKMNGDD